MVNARKNYIKRFLACLLCVCQIINILPVYADLLEVDDTSVFNEFSEEQLAVAQNVVVDENLLLSADIYNSEVSGSSGNAICSLISDGTMDENGNLVLSDMGEWNHEQSRFMYIQLSGIPMESQYELVVTMQPIIKAMSLPDVAGTTRSFTQNTMDVNNGGTFKAENYSGTIVWSIDKGTSSLGFAIELGYDITLWNKLKGELNNNPETPLVSVFLRTKGTEEEINKINLHKAQADKTWSESIYFLADGSTQVANKFKNETVSIGLERMINGSYSHGFYYPKITFTIGYPKYVYNGTTYYLDCDSSKIQNYVTEGSADIQVEQDDENHTVSITYNNYYSASNKQFNNLIFSMSKEVADALPPGSYPFKMTPTITVYRNADDTIGENIGGINSSTCNITYSNQENYKLEKKTSEGTASIVNPDLVHHLGTYGIRNSGFGDSGELRIRMDFDTDNKNAIHVTTARLFADNVQEVLEVEYSMIDENGQIVVENATCTIDNSYYGYTGTMEKTRNHLFSRADIPEEHRNYYFKSIEYTLKKVPANTDLYGTSGIKNKSATGTYWGYVNGKASDVANTSITVWDVVGEREDKNANMSANIKTRIYGTGDSSYILNTPKVDKTQVQAGDSVTVSGIFEVSSYPYSYTQGVKKVRIGLYLPQGIEFEAKDVTAKTATSKKDIRDIVVIKPSDGNPLWIVELSDPDVLLGYNTEELAAISDGAKLNFSITLHTSSTMDEQTLLLRNILWAAGDGQTNRPSGAQQEYRCEEFKLGNVQADLNNYTGSNDYVACFTPSVATQFTIKAAPALLDISASIRGSSENTGDLDAALEHFADYVTYDLQIACNDGGRAKDFFYLIPIPKVDSPLNEDFVKESHVNLELRRMPTITHSSGADFKLLYTTADAASLNYEYASIANGEGTDITNGVQWLEADQITEWNKVTMIKVVAKSDFIETGTLSVISVPLYYAGNNYEYKGDADTFAQDAGRVVNFSARGYYSHSKGNMLYAGTESVALSTVRLEYTIPETQRITLTAAKERKPANGSVTGSFIIDTQFLLDQNYEVRMVEPSNVTLVSSKSDFTKVNNNTTFGIAVSLNGKASYDLHQDASVENPISLGKVNPKQSAEFTFEIFNGDALSDTTTPRTVKLDIIGHNGVTIPVEITIKVEATAVENVELSIIDYKEYMPFSGIDNVSISKDSAFTAQFVVQELIPNNYPSRTLSFDSAPTSGTTILMIDWTDRSNPKYYHAILDGNKTSIQLSEFTDLATEQYYENPTGADEIPEETLLFIVDFPDAEQNCKSIMLTWDSATNSGVEALSYSLDFSVSDKRTFDLDVEFDKVELEQEFDILYENTAPISTDNFYSNRKMTLVITPENNSLPKDARLVAGDDIYYRNAQGQFILPLGSLSISGTSNDSNTVKILSETLVDECDINVALYVSATANDSQPMAGEKIIEKSFKVVPNSKPAFKIESMSKRLFILGKDELAAKIEFNKLDIDDCSVHMEVQKKSGTGYAADKFYLKTLDGVQATNISLNITDIVNAGDSMNLIFHDDLDIGTYRILITVSKNNVDVLSVPYNFLVINK